ncbi:MAG: hypothetical protein A2171_01810 [Candidatus Levybacteria bacterium RBG_13_35_9]|nr:MAG: hypothetical protein A2171_01810 [Candidatus Levybacteria bacterium RBG_13_35_9]
MKKNNTFLKNRLGFINKYFINTGFTLTELVVAMAILFVISGFVTISLINQQRTASLNSSIDVLISDISSQQTKAMSGASDGLTSASNYGIYFLDDRYILFKGTSFLATDSANFTIMLDKDIEFANVGFSGNSIVFSARSGEILGFTAGSNVIAIHDVSSGEINTITINRYGVVESIN